MSWSYFFPSAAIETWPWDGGDVVALDALVLFISAAACITPCPRETTLLLASLLLGALTEFGAIRCGGTHCHNAGLLNFLCAQT